MARFTRPILAAALFATACGGGAFAAQTGLALLARVPAGSWELREIGSDRPPTTVCIREPAQLLQLQHLRARCSRYIVSQDGKAATVQYLCPGAGQGRTTLTVEDADAVRISTQGIANAAPFDVDYEAHRLGTCA